MTINQLIESVHAVLAERVVLKSMTPQEVAQTMNILTEYEGFAKKVAAGHYRIEDVTEQQPEEDINEVIFEADDPF